MKFKIVFLSSLSLFIVTLGFLIGYWYASRECHLRVDLGIQDSERAERQWLIAYQRLIREGNITQLSELIDKRLRDE